MITTDEDAVGSTDATGASTSSTTASGFFVLAQAETARMPGRALGGHFRVDDLADEPGFQPMGTAHFRARRLDRCLLALEPHHDRHQAEQLGIVETSTDLPRVAELALIMHGENGFESRRGHQQFHGFAGTKSYRLRNHII